MMLTGLVILVFLVVHLAHFRLQKAEGVSMAGLVRHELGKPLGAGVYVVGMIALAMHVSHAFQSALQTLGINHPKYTPLARKFSLVLGVVLGLGFATFPLYVFFLGGNA